LYWSVSINLLHLVLAKYHLCVANHHLVPIMVGQGAEETVVNHVQRCSILQCGALCLFVSKLIALI